MKREATMPISDGTRAFQQATSDGQRHVFTPELTPDAAQLSGKWIASVDTVVVEP